MGYHHPSHPVALDPARYDMLILGSEPISRSRRRAARAAALYAARHGRCARAVPVLYAERVSRPHDGSHRRECDDTAVPRSRLRDRHGRRAEGDGARGPRVAFLPHSAVEDAVAGGRLIRLDRSVRGAHPFTLTMEIRLYCDKLALQGDDPRQKLVLGTSCATNCAKPRVNRGRLTASLLSSSLRSLSDGCPAAVRRQETRFFTHAMHDRSRAFLRKSTADLRKSRSCKKRIIE